MALSRFWSGALLLALLQMNPSWGRHTQPGLHEPGLQGQKNNPPMQAPQPVTPKFDAAQVMHDAEELAALAKEVPPGIDQANKGLISKDLNDRLKRIEKLSKQLRRELFP